MTIRTLAQVAFVSLAATFAVAQVEAQDATEKNRRIYQEAVADPTNPQKVDVFIATLIEAPRGSGKYLVEGDILLSRAEIESYLKRLKSPNPGQMNSEELIVNVFGGQLDYIRDPNRRQMTYVVNAQSFPTPAAAQTVRTNFRKAADDWQAACPACGITFTEMPSPAAGGDGARPAFVVRYENVEGGPIARAFFPSTAPDDRSVVIFPGYFGAMGFDAVGVLRHEIGHILGYRHEHIRNIPGCFTEGTDWKPLTPYTPNSVMHYFCGGAGSMDLSIRPADKRGHECLYLTGRPCAGPQ